ncbi:MAG: spore photoproduct lyase family protein [Lachnospiraceae bacterium]
MITIITALYAEAKPFIECFALKRNTSEPLLTLFEGEEIRILITGVGPMAACMAVTRCFTLFPPERTDLVANVGLAGYVTSADTRSAAIGSCYLALKLTECSTERTFYPDLLYPNSFAKAQVMTASAVVTESSARSADSLPLLADMEAAAVYQAALPYLSTERMFFFKIVSDETAAKQQACSSVRPEALIVPHAASISDFLTQVQTYIANEPANHPVTFSVEEQMEIDRLLDVLPMTASMQQELFHLLRYHKLCGNSVTELISSFLQGLPSELPHGKKQTVPYLKQLSALVLSAQEKTSVSPLPPVSPSLPVPQKEASYLPFFSAVYVEKELWEQRKTLIPRQLLARSEHELTVLPIGHYKDVFNRSRQNLASQKHAPALILASNHGTLLYPGAPVCQSFGNEHFYYTSNVLNCIYHCDYCYLQGMYPSGHVVAFLNLPDYFAEVTELLRKHPVYLCISYDTDLLALEPLFHFTEQWVRFAAHHPELTLEIRTKSGNPEVFSVLRSAWEEEQNGTPCNLVFAWTVSPEELSRSTEHGAAPLALRLKALKAAKDAGFSVRLCFDPMIYHTGWQEAYRELIQQIFEQDGAQISAEDLNDVSIGVFRISTEYLKAMRKRRPDSPLVQFPYTTENGVSHYGSLSETMVQYLYELLLNFVPAERIFVWKGI